MFQQASTLMGLQFTAPIGLHVRFDQPSQLGSCSPCSLGLALVLCSSGLVLSMRELRRPAAAEANPRRLGSGWRRLLLRLRYRSAGRPRSTSEFWSEVPGDAICITGARRLRKESATVTVNGKPSLLENCSFVRRG